MKRLILHIGTHKTATTSLQSFLRLNAKEIGKQDIFVPFFPGKFYRNSPDRNAQFLTRRVMQAFSSTYTDEDLTPLIDKQVALFKKHVAEHDTVLLSDERLWYEMAGVDGYCAELKRVLDECGIDEVSFVVYLRRQDKLMTSFYRQMIETRYNEVRSFDAFASDKRSVRLLDYKRGLDIIERDFPECKITVRVFEPKNFEGGDVYHDFCAACGIEFTDGIQIPQDDMNPSAGPNVAEIKRLANELPLKDYTGRNHFKPACFMIGGSSKEPRNRSYLSAEEQAAFMARYEQDNAEIARKYLGREDGVLFKTSDLPIPQWEPDSLQFAKDAVQFLGQALLCEQRYTERLEEQIKQQEKRIAELERSMKRIESVNRNSLVLKAERKVRGRDTLEGGKRKKKGK